MQSPYPQSPPLSGPHTLAYYPPALITPGLDTSQVGTATLPQRPLKLSNQANPKPAYFASFVPFHRNKIKTLTHPSTLPPLPLVLLHVVLRDVACPLLGTRSNKLSFQWQWNLSPDLLSLPYINNNKTN